MEVGVADGRFSELFLNMGPYPNPALLSRLPITADGRVVGDGGAWRAAGIV
eukprot:gene52295-24343_t